MGFSRFTSRHFLVIDETHKKRSDTICPYRYSPIGENDYAYNWVPPGDARYSGIESFSIEGPQSVSLFNTTEDTIDGHTFLLVLENEILHLMNAFPGDRSVLLLDNCRIHLKI